MDSVYDLIIIGGGCAGLTAGIYAGRANLKTVILEKQFAGGQAAITNEIANYPGFKNISGYNLTKSMLEQARSFGTEFISQGVKEVDFSKEIKKVYTDKNVFKGYTVIIAAGASPREAGFEGERKFKGRGISYCASCDGFFYSGKNVFIVGSGYSAAQEALYLSRIAKKITMLIRKDRLKCPPSIIKKLRENPKVEIMFNTEIVEVSGVDNLERAVLRNNITNEVFTYTEEKNNTFGVFVFVGYKPSTEFIKKYIKTDKDGYILTNEEMETNIKGIYAAGDLRQKSLRQIITAASDGAVAASMAERYINEYRQKNVQIICKCEQTIA